MTEPLEQVAEVPHDLPEQVVATVEPVVSHAPTEGNPAEHGAYEPHTTHESHSSHEPHESHEPVAEEDFPAEAESEEPAAEPESEGELEAEAEPEDEPAPKRAKVSKPRKPRAAPKAPAAAAPIPSLNSDPKSEGMKWYILKVQSNREESIRDGLIRRVAIQGLDRFFGDIIVPTEKVTEFKGGKKKVIKRKLYPGYLVVHMEINEDTWFLVRETPGIGDFTGAQGVPTAMLDHEVNRIVAKQEEKSEKAPELKIAFATGDKVKINEGTFENFEGEVDSIDKTNGRVTVMITIFNRTTPVELEYWQVEAL